VVPVPDPVKTKNSMVRVRERTPSTERPPLVGEVIANFWTTEAVGCGSFYLNSIPHCQDNRLTDEVRLSALRTGRALLPRNIICLLLVLISVRY
jgi:hypothetical protein